MCVYREYATAERSKDGDIRMDFYVDDEGCSHHVSDFSLTEEDASIFARQILGAIEGD
mgnify:CR=1 FL=1